MAAKTARLAMSAQVKTMNAEAAAAKKLGQIVIPSTVLAKSVDEHNATDRARRLPPP
jgi:hypothetical protein